MSNKVKAALIVFGGVAGFALIVSMLAIFETVAIGALVLLLVVMVSILLKLLWELVYEELEHREWKKHREVE